MIEKKIREYDEAIKKDPKNPVLWFEKGKLLSTIGDMDGAVQAFQTATSIKPDYFEAWDALGDVYMELGQKDKASECYKKVVETATKETKIPTLCPRCGKEIAPGEEVCKVCGFVLSEPQAFSASQLAGDIYHCPLCGAKVDYNASSCSCCGVPILDEHPADPTIVHVLRRELKHTVIPPSQNVGVSSTAETPKKKFDIKESSTKESRITAQEISPEQTQKNAELEVGEGSSEINEYVVSGKTDQTSGEDLRIYLESINAVSEIPQPKKKKVTFFDDPTNIVLTVALIMGLVILAVGLIMYFNR